MLLEGIFLPLTTPFHPDGALYLSKLAANVRRYSLTPAAGMLVGSGVGEGPALTDAETEDVLRTAIGSAADEKVMVADVSRSSVFATLELAGLAESLVYDAVGLGAGQSLLYYQLVADKSPLPVVLLDASAEMVLALAGHSNVLGASSQKRVTGLPGISREVTVTPTFYAATRRMLRRGGSELLSAASLTGPVQTYTAPVKTRSKKVGFQLLTSGTATMLSAWQAGAVGAIPALSACAPQGCCEVWQAYRDGDLPLAAEKQDRIQLAAALTQTPAAIKHGADLNGYFGGRPRLPELPLTEAEKVAIGQSLASLRT